MPEYVPRLLVIITGVIAILALFVGIRDYVGGKRRAQSPVSAAVPKDAASNAVPARKQSTRAKRAQASPTEQSAPSSALPADTAEHSLVSEKLGEVQSPHAAPITQRAQAPNTELTVTPSLPSCAPLPNSTKPEDVDATYYQSWAREYGCKLD